MAISTIYSYKDRNIFDIETLIVAIRFIIVNFILAFIFLFLTLEEIDWAFFSYREEVTTDVIDITSWNIKELF